MSVDQVTFTGFTDRALVVQENDLVTLSSCTFTDNEWAGLAYIYGDQVVVENSLFQDNYVSIIQYYVYYYYPAWAQLEVYNSTFVGGTMGLDVCPSSYGPLILQDNIFAGQSYQPYFCELYWEEPTAEDWQPDNNIVWDVGERGYGRDWWGDTYIEADPLFVDWSDDDDPTNDDLRLQDGSPAIDAAVSATLLTDYEGSTRPLDGDADGVAVADIGAYEYVRDVDGDGYMDAAVGGDDCDDASAAVHPDAAEVCDGLDDDCDGSIDEGAVDAATWHADADADGWTTDATATACEAPTGYVADATDPSDCADDDPARYPGAEDSPGDGVDQDCDGVDASVVDTGSPPDTGVSTDTGSPPDTGVSTDTGSPPDTDVSTDTGSPPETGSPDSVSPEDSGKSADDTGTPASDSGSPEDDVPGTADTGAIEKDGGCGCGTGTGAGFAPMFLAMLALRRRRRERRGD